MNNFNRIPFARKQMYINRAKLLAILVVLLSIGYISIKYTFVSIVVQKKWTDAIFLVSLFYAILGMAFGALYVRLSDKFFRLTDDISNKIKTSRGNWGQVLNLES